MSNDELILEKINNLTEIIEKNNVLVHKRIDADNLRHKESIKALKDDHIKPVKDSVFRVYIWMGLIVVGFITAVFKESI